MCAFPAGCLARHGRASAALSSRRPPKSLFHRPASPVRTAAVPNRFFRGRPCPRTACPAVCSACPAVPADPRTTAVRPAFRWHRGPRPVGWLRHPFYGGGTRGDGGGSHHLAGPVASNCILIAVPHGCARLEHAAEVSARHRAGRPAVRRLVPSGERLRCHQAGRFQKPSDPMPWALPLARPVLCWTCCQRFTGCNCACPRTVPQVSTHHRRPIRVARSSS